MLKVEVFTKTVGMTHLYKKVWRIVLIERLKISYFNQLNCKSTMGNYVMLYKEEKEQKICRFKVSILLSVCWNYQ